jgi:hypothetical protein
MRHPHNKRAKPYEGDQPDKNGLSPEAWDIIESLGRCTKNGDQK